MKQKHHFIGLKVSPELHHILMEVQNSLNVSEYYKKVTHPEDFHLTLLFLGGWEKTKVSRLWTTLQSNLKIAPFELSLTNTNIFGNENQPRVLWAGVEENSSLFHLQKTVAREGGNLGFPLEKRPYRPHITLAKTYQHTDYIKDYYYSFRNNTWEINEMRLFEINPGKMPMYQSVSVIQFSG